MKLSEERISHLSHVILDKVWRDDLADLTDDRLALDQVKRSITDFFSIEEDMENAVLAKLKGKIPGSRDYDILYRKYYQEEQAKRKW